MPKGWKVGLGNLRRTCIQCGAPLVTEGEQRERYGGRCLYCEAERVQGLSDEEVCQDAAITAALT